MEDGRDGVIFESEHGCWCGGEPKRVNSVPFEAGPRLIILGQCSECGEIRWSYWRAPEEALEDPDAARTWGRLAVEAALRKRGAKSGRKA